MEPSPKNRRPPVPLLAAVGAVGLTLGCLLFGYEPVGGDPDNLYRPIKQELGRALKNGSLPFWSDRFGLGAALAAESHAASFYPPNWLLYGALDTSTAYRLAMFLSYLGIAGATYGYARSLAISPWGSALSSVSFALCGFQMSHACHEPLYNLMPYLPLSLWMAERYMARGGVGALAALALVLGAQITLGHFQIQMWTAGLVALTGLWRAAQKVGPWRRAAGLFLAVGWGGCVAAAQLGLTWELVRAAGFDRPAIYLTNYAFPPAHLAQPALPRLFMWFKGNTLSPVWYDNATSPDEACLYVGTVALVLASVGWTSKGDKALSLWKWLAVAGVVMATMPRWFLDGFLLLLKLPGIGHFRAPGRYVLFTSLGLCLLAGRGFDLTPSRRFWKGLRLALAVGVASFGWALWWSSQPKVLEAIGESARRRHFGEAALAWALALAAVLAWRARPGRATAWSLFLIAAAELGYLYHSGTVPWGWSVDLPAASPVLRRLAEEKHVGRVAGNFHNVVVRGGHVTAWPYLGVTPPPPNYLLEDSTDPDNMKPNYLNWLPRFGITHGVYKGARLFRISEVLYIGRDDALDAILPPQQGVTLPRTYRLERYLGAFPHARAATRVRVEPDWYKLYEAISESIDPDVAWFLAKDVPADPPGPRATSAKVVRWDGLEGEVEHNGTVDLVVLRPNYPGWTAVLNEKSPATVVSADYGVQSVRLPGKGPTRVRMSYEPTNLRKGLALSTSATAAAVGVILWSWLRRRARRPIAE